MNAINNDIDQKFEALNARILVLEKMAVRLNTKTNRQINREDECMSPVMQKVFNRVEQATH